MRWLWGDKVKVKDKGKGKGIFYIISSIILFLKTLLKMWLAHLVHKHQVLNISFRLKFPRKTETIEGYNNTVVCEASTGCRHML